MLQQCYLHLSVDYVDLHLNSLIVFRLLLTYKYLESVLQMNYCVVVVRDIEIDYP